MKIEISFEELEIEEIIKDYIVQKLNLGDEYKSGSVVINKRFEWVNTYEVLSKKDFFEQKMKDEVNS